jgi:hypothetical protein
MISFVTARIAFSESSKEIKIFCGIGLNLHYATRSAVTAGSWFPSASTTKLPAVAVGSFFISDLGFS